MNEIHTPVMPFMLYTGKKFEGEMTRIGEKFLTDDGRDTFITDEHQILRQSIMSYLVNADQEDCTDLERAGLTPRRIARDVRLTRESDMIEVDMLFFGGLRSRSPEEMREMLHPKTYSDGIIGHLIYTFGKKYGVSDRMDYIRRNRRPLARIISAEIAKCTHVRNVPHVMRVILPKKIAKKYANERIVRYIRTKSTGEKHV